MFISDRFQLYRFALKSPLILEFPPPAGPGAVGHVGTRGACWGLAALGAALQLREPTELTHLRQQQADLLHFLQRQQRVADRMLEQHVQQNLKRTGARPSVKLPSPRGRC